KMRVYVQSFVHTPSYLISRYSFYIFNNFALIATMMVLKLIKIAPTAGLKTMPTGASIPAASGIAIMLYPEAHHKLCTIFVCVFLDNSLNVTTSFGLLLTSTISADSIATSVPAPIALPKSAVAKAGG